MAGALGDLEHLPGVLPCEYILALGRHADGTELTLAIGSDEAPCKDQDATLYLRFPSVGITADLNGETLVEEGRLVVGLEG